MAAPLRRELDQAQQIVFVASGGERGYFVLCLSVLRSRINIPLFLFGEACGKTFAPSAGFFFTTGKTFTLRSWIFI